MPTETTRRFSIVVAHTSRGIRYAYSGIVTLPLSPDHPILAFESIGPDRHASEGELYAGDATALLTKLVRFAQGERRVWSVVHVPSVTDEDGRQMHRELFRLTGERTRQINRIKGLLALHGVAPLAQRGLPRTLPVVRAWNGDPLPPGAAARLAREWKRLTFLRRELHTLLTERRALLRARDDDDPIIMIVRRLRIEDPTGHTSRNPRCVSPIRAD